MSTLAFHNLAKGDPIIQLVGTQGEVQMLDRIVGGPRAWTRDTVNPAHWTVAVPAQAYTEIDGMVDAMHKDPLPLLLYGVGVEIRRAQP